MTSESHTDSFMPTSNASIDVTLVIATNCSHCQQVLTDCADLVKHAEIDELQIINISSVPEKAQAFNIRSVPFIKIGPFELFGAHTKTELRQWLNRLNSPKGMEDYFNELFEQGELERVSEIVQTDHHQISTIINMMANEDTPLGSRIGISAIFEQLQGDAKLAAHIQELADLTDSDNVSIRIDTAHYLGLTQNIKAIPWLEKLSNDINSEVQTTALEGINMIKMPEVHV